MTISQALERKISNLPAGEIFGYQALPHYNTSPMAVIKAVGRMVRNHKLERFSKGQFYVPKAGVFGARKPSDSELIRSVLYKNGILRGYITGAALYNKLGLTTQVPSTVTIALNGGSQKKDFGTIKLRMMVTHIPIIAKDVKHLEYLDALKDIKRIPDSDINVSLQIIRQHIANMTDHARKSMMRIAQKHYSPQVRALVGLLFASQAIIVPNSLKESLNPTTVYKLGLDEALWPLAKTWNIA